MTAKPPRDVRGIALGVGAVLALTAVAVAATFGLALAFDVDFDDLSRDPTTVYKGPVYAGWFSNLVVLLWQVPAPCALLTAAVLRSTRRGGAPMFLAAGLLTAVLAVDDLFLLHEFLAEAIGLPQLVLPVVYGVAVGAFAWIFRRGMGTDIVFLALALACWTGSVALAVFANQHGQLVVSAAKFAGVGFWTLLIVRLALAALRAAAVEGSADETDPATDSAEVPAEAPAGEAAAAEEPAAAPAAPPSAAAVAPPAAEESPAPAPAPAPAPVPAPVAAPAAVPAEPATTVQRVVPPAPVRRDPYAEAETGPVPVAVEPDGARTVAQPVVPPVSAQPVEPDRQPTGTPGGRRRLEPQPPDRRPRPPVEPGRPPPARPDQPRPEPQRPRHRRP